MSNKPSALQVEIEPMPGYQFTKRGLEHIEDAEAYQYKHWYATGASLSTAEGQVLTSLALAWGDWIDKGVKKKYESVWDDAVEHTKKTLSTVQNYRWISRSVPIENRGLPGINLSHLKHVAKFKDPIEQKAWLMLASEERLDAKEFEAKLQHSLLLASGNGDDEPDPEKDVAPPTGSRMSDKVFELEVEQEKLQKEVRRQGRSLSALINGAAQAQTLIIKNVIADSLTPTQKMAALQAVDLITTERGSKFALMLSETIKDFQDTVDVDSLEVRINDLKELF